MQKLTHPELLARQFAKQQESRLPFSVLVNNVRSLYNVGSIFRTADAVGVEKLWLCGITGIPPDTKISKTALGAEAAVPWEFRKDPKTVIELLKKRGYEILLLEQTCSSIPYQDYRPAKPVCLILGSEVEGVSDSLVECCDKAIEIEMAGLKNSLNVTVAFGIAGYHIRQCFRSQAPRE